MSTQYPGGFITKSPVAPTTTAASGIWTVDQALQYVKAGTWPSPPIFIEDLFSTWLYTGDGTNDRVITNNINISGNGGMVMTAPRSTGNFWSVADTARGAANWIYTNSDGAQQNGTDRYGSFTTTGYTLGSSSANSYINGSGTTYVSWTFAKQPKFFDVVTYTGNGVAGRTVSHSLGSVPGCIIIKKTSAAGSDWITYHRGLASPAGSFMNLNLTQAVVASTTIWNNTAPTSSVFSLGSNTPVNGSGVSYVAYLFAHDAGGFPANGGGSTNGISCGSFTTTAGGIGTVTLGYEPQWVLIKNTTTGGAGYDWFLLDSMRGMTSPPTAGGAALRPNTTDAEATGQDYIQATSTGFVVNNNPSSNYIYIAIRRGPMKTPTVGTSVFGINARTGTGVDVTVTGGTLPDDVAVIKARSTGAGALWAARLTGTGYAQSDGVTAIAAAGTTILQANPWDVMDGIKVGTTSSITNASGATYINYLLSRAPGFMDVVCYEGIDPSIEHNLGVTPEMYIVKSRSATGATGGRWSVYHTGYATATNYITLNSTNGVTAGTIWGSGPTASVIGATGGTPVNDVGQTYIAYLFATLAGISKVGSYTGTGALQTVNCGFTSGARFVLIKRTDTTGDWYTYDSARGLSSSTDPYFLMNSSAAETTGTNYVDTTSTGFQVTAAAPAGLNAVGGNYIFLAIA